MDNISVTIPMSISLINKIDKESRLNNLSFEEYIIRELQNSTEDKVKTKNNTRKSCASVIEKYRNIK